MNDLKKLIREVPDYPKPGILFYDLTTLLKDKEGFHTLIDRLCDHYKGHTIDVVAGIEARGFIFAPALAYRLNAGFVPVRKPKKLPAKTASVSPQNCHPERSEGSAFFRNARSSQLACNGTDASFSETC